MEERMAVNGVEYTVLKLLGHGKGGYSYLVERGGERYVLKQIHHEPCDYYTFGNKIEAERRDYELLRKTGIRMPQMLDIDLAQERILKEYIAGPTVCELIWHDAMKDCYVEQGRGMAAAAYAAGLNIDFFPTNFVVQDDLIYYVDFECNPYAPEWDFEHWGAQYWAKTPAFVEATRGNGDGGGKNA